MQSHKNRILISALLACATTVLPAFSQAEDKKNDLVDAVHEYKINSWWQSIIVNRLMNFNLSPGIWNKMLEKDGWGIRVTSNVADQIGTYAQKQGWADLEAIESGNNSDRNKNKPQVEQTVDGLKDKISFTLDANTIKGTDAEWDLVHRYMGILGQWLVDGSWTPKQKVAFITLNVSPSAKDIAVAVSPDGKNFKVTVPAETEPNEWDSKILKGLNR
jgi:hypothetical protein